MAQPAKGERLRDLLRALRKAGITSEDPIRGHLLREPMELGGDSLLAILRSEELDSATVASQLATACRLTRTIQDQAASHLAGMRAAGHTPPSADEAQAALDTVLTLLEWDDV